MANTVPVPKDLSGIKTKVMFNLTKRQLICFSIAAVIGIPLYMFMKPIVGHETALVIMVFSMMPFFFVAMYRRDGFPAEILLFFRIRHAILPGVRPYRSQNIYSTLLEKDRIRREIIKLETDQGTAAHNKKRTKKKAIANRKAEA